MLFLVQLETRLRPEMPSGEREALVAREARRGRELVADGVIRHIWRLPGRLANVGVWFAPDSDSLHEAILSLPAWPWMTVTVTPLAHHPLLPADADAGRQFGDRVWALGEPCGRSIASSNLDKSND